MSYAFNPFTKKMDYYESSSGSLTAKLVNTSRDNTAASGDVSYTGFGGRPKAIFIFGAKAATYMMSQGYADGTSNFCAINWYGTTPGTWSYSTTQIAYFAYDGSNSQDAVLKSFDADGCTLTWTKTGSPTGTSYFGIMALF